ncbi:hypothetical protein JL720_6089 [Aureococcus anophagefferens]|nr:hypothetical protein JL720_6089 [Aureococcus anophagefferens]
MEVIPGEVMPDDEVVEIWDELKTRPFSLSYLGGNPRARQAFGQLEKMELTIEDVARDGASAFGDLSLLFSVRVCKQTLCGDDTVDDESVVVISRAANTVPPLVPKRFWLAGVAGAKPPGHPHNVEQARDASAVCSLFVEDVERHKNGGPHKLEDHLHRHVANPAASRPCESRVRNVETSLDFMTRAAPSNHQGKAQIKSERPQGSRAECVLVVYLLDLLRPLTVEEHEYCVKKVDEKNGTKREKNAARDGRVASGPKVLGPKSAPERPTVSAASPASPVSARPLPRLPTAPAAKRVGVSALSSTTALMLGTRPTVSAASLASPMSAKPLPRLLPAPVAKRDGVPASPFQGLQAAVREAAGDRAPPRRARRGRARGGVGARARGGAAPAPTTPMVMGDEPDEPDEPATASDGASLSSAGPTRPPFAQVNVLHRVREAAEARASRLEEEAEAEQAAAVEAEDKVRAVRRGLEPKLEQERQLETQQRQLEMQLAELRLQNRATERELSSLEAIARARRDTVNRRGAAKASYSPGH